MGTNYQAEIEEEVREVLTAPDASVAARLERSILEKQDLCRGYATEKVHLAAQARQLLESSISTLESQLEQVREPSVFSRPLERMTDVQLIGY